MCNKLWTDATVDKPPGCVCLSVWLRLIRVCLICLSATAGLTNTVSPPKNVGNHEIIIYLFFCNSWFHNKYESCIWSVLDVHEPNSQGKKNHVKMMVREGRRQSWPIINAAGMPWVISAGMVPSPELKNNKKNEVLSVEVGPAPDWPGLEPWEWTIEAQTV